MLEPGNSEAITGPDKPNEPAACLSPDAPAAAPALPGFPSGTQQDWTDYFRLAGGGSSSNHDDADPEWVAKAGSWMARRDGSIKNQAKRFAIGSRVLAMTDFSTEWLPGTVTGHDYYEDDWSETKKEPAPYQIKLDATGEKVPACSSYTRYIYAPTDDDSCVCAIPARASDLPSENRCNDCGTTCPLYHDCDDGLNCSQYHYCGKEGRQKTRRRRKLLARTGRGANVQQNQTESATLPKCPDCDKRHVHCPDKKDEVGQLSGPEAMSLDELLAFVEGGPADSTAPKLAGGGGGAGKKAKKAKKKEKRQRKSAQVKSEAEEQSGETESEHSTAVQPPRDHQKDEVEERETDPGSELAFSDSTSPAPSTPPSTPPRRHPGYKFELDLEPEYPAAASELPVAASVALLANKAALFENASSNTVTERAAPMPIPMQHRGSTTVVVNTTTVVTPDSPVFEAPCSRPLFSAEEADTKSSAFETAMDEVVLTRRAAREAEIAALKVRMEMLLAEQAADDELQRQWLRMPKVVDSSTPRQSTSKCCNKCTLGSSRPEELLCRGITDAQVITAADCECDCHAIVAAGREAILAKLAEGVGALIIDLALCSSVLSI